MPMFNYERLSDDIKIAVSSDHTFGTDAVILSDFAKIKPRDKALDMGTGCGIIPLLWLRNEKINNVSCLDIQKNAYEQVCHSIEINHLEDRIKPFNCDLRKINEIFEAENFSLVTMKAANYLLKYGGRFCMCHRPERLVDTLELMRKYKLEPKRLRFVQDKNTEQPFLFLVQGQKGAKPFLRVEPQLIIKKENGKFTPEMLDIYGSYADGYDK